jgi:hypothetical protein
VPAGELEGLRDAHHLADSFEKLEVAMIKIAVDADRTKNRVRSAGGAMHIEAAGDYAVDYVLNLLFGGALVHDNNHG